MKNFQSGIFALCALLLTRLAGMALIPLNETTEARYGEIARKMLETHNWVTLMHSYDVPFLAKPPLYAWLSTVAMGILGVNEFTVRLPSLLLSIGMLALVGQTAFRRNGRDAAMTVVLVLAGSLGFFIAAGTVMTDPALVFCVTLILISFWHALHPAPAAPEKTAMTKGWGYTFFIGCGLGLLAKGPVALVLAGLPVFFWVLIRKQWKPLWQKLPWISGGALMLAIALPWYVLAEQRTPGFLHYFIIGENISRFLDPHWKGDLYGFAHAYPCGMIWLFVIAGLFPWCFTLLRRWQTPPADKDGWLLFLALWSVSSPLFFTFAANIIWPYCLIMQPGFALLFGELWQRTGKPESRHFPTLALLTALAGMAAIMAFTFLAARVGQDQKDVITAWKNTEPASNSQLIFWSNRMEFSAQFYSGGRVKTTEDPQVVRALMFNSTRDCIIAYDYNEAALPKTVRDTFREIGRFTNARGVRILLCEP